MIAVIDVHIQAANPCMPLYPWRAFVGSPSSLRVRNVPKKIGTWQITSVDVQVEYPDNIVLRQPTKLVGGVWVATLVGSSSSGMTKNGYTIVASGIDENGDVVSDYILGKGDVEILNADSLVEAGIKVNTVKIFEEQPEEPKDGDMWYDGEKYVLYYNGQATEIGGGFEPTTEQLAALNSGITAEKVDSMLDEQDVKDIVLEEKPASGEWICEPSEYEGEKIEIKNDGNNYYPYVPAYGEIGSPLYAERLEDGVKLIWDGNWGGLSPLVATYKAGELENALGLVLNKNLSGDVIDIVLEEKTLKFEWICEPSEYNGSKIEVAHDSENLYALYADGNQVGGSKPSTVYPPAEGATITWEANGDWSGDVDLVATYKATESENALGLVTYDYLSANAIPKYEFETATEAGAITLKPYTSTSLTSTGTNFTVAIEASTENKSRECMLVVEASDTTPTITWPDYFHPRTDSATDFVCEAGRNVYWISEYINGQFVVARWLETTGEPIT